MAKQTKDEKRISKALVKWVEEVAQLYQEKLQAAGIRYTGALEDQIFYGMDWKPDKDILSAASTFKTFLTLAEEWQFVEYGRQPGTFPNVNALKRYVRLKPVIPQPYTLPNGQTRIPTVNQLAFLIGRKIKEEGIEPNPLLSETLRELRMGLILALREAVSDAVRDQMNINFEI